MTTLEHGPPSAYRFADLTLDVGERSVTRQGRPLALKSLDFDLLQCLVESAPKVVNADLLAEKVWGRHFVSPENVAQRVMLLRQSLADDASRPRYIETVRNRGYRLIPAVARIGPRGAPRRARPMPAAGAALALLAFVAGTGYWLRGSLERPPASPDTVAVLPFDNLSPDPDDAFFAVGMQAEIVRQLRNISGLRAFPVQPEAAAGRNAVDVGRELEVATVLSGSVHYADERLRGNVDLTETSTAANLWSESYERERQGIFAIQSDIALELASALKVKLSAAEQERVTNVPTTVPEARDSYLVALAKNPLSGELQSAIDDVERATEIDPKFKEAWVLDARLRFFAQFIYADHAEEHRRRAEQAALTAIDIDPELKEAHHALGLLYQSSHEWAKSELELRKAGGVDMPPDKADAYAGLHMQTGRFDTVEFELLEAARVAAPLNEVNHRAVAFVHEERGERARADEVYETALTLFRAREDDRAVGIVLYQRMLWLIGRNELSAARAVADSDALSAAMFASLDDPVKALAVLREEYAATGTGNPERRRDIGLWAAHFGDPRLALEALGAAIAEQGVMSVYLWLPQMAPARRLPEFKTFARDMGFVAYYEQYGWPLSFCRPLDAGDFECH